MLEGLEHVVGRAGMLEGLEHVVGRVCWRGWSTW